MLSLFSSPTALLNNLELKYICTCDQIGELVWFMHSKKGMGPRKVLTGEEKPFVLWRHFKYINMIMYHMHYFIF